MMTSHGRAIQVAPGRVLTTTAVYDTYWRFAAKRQAVFMMRVAGLPPPWTDDPVIAAHRFTNVYRASDRVSQYLVRRVLYEGLQSAEEIYFRALLFKMFNRISTWEELTAQVGPLTWKTFNADRYARVLDKVIARGDRVYSAAYIMPSPTFGYARKHSNHLRLLESMMTDGAPLRVSRARTLQEVFAILRSYRSVGDFLAFQFAIDLNYSNLLQFSEMDFVVAGPGAQEGIRKCFTDTGGLSDADVIRAVTDRAEEEFKRLGLTSPTLWGRRLQLIDCQNLFCEVAKYARIVHPDVQGMSGRTRIKQKFKPERTPILQWYPPKWQLQLGVAETPALRSELFLADESAPVSPKPGLYRAGAM